MVWLIVSSVRLAWRITKDAISADELDPGLFLCALHTRDQDGADFSRHAYMRSAACGPVVTRYVDYADFAGALGRLSQSGLRNIFLSDVADRNVPVVANDTVRQILRALRLFS